MKTQSGADAKIHVGAYVEITTSSYVHLRSLLPEEKFGTRLSQVFSIPPSLIVAVSDTKDRSRFVLDWGAFVSITAETIDEMKKEFEHLYAVELNALRKCSEKVSIGVGVLMIFEKPEEEI